MTLNYFDTQGISHLIDEIFHLSFSHEDVPFQTTILPIGSTSITYIYSKEQISTLKGKITPLKGLMLTGQFYGSYKFSVNEKGYSFGINLHPTALHKITELDVSKLTNHHIPLQEVSKDLFEKLYPFFNKNHSDLNALAASIKEFLATLTLVHSVNIDSIDLAIDIIKSKEGMLNVNDILDEVAMSQKTLETQFKKIVGLTPGKYIRAYRFLKLMRKYESQEIELKDLIYMYNYYDQSHFAKDFKLFMKETPQSYFKKQYPLLKEYLKN